MNPVTSKLTGVIDPLWVSISIFLILIVALLFRYELKFIRTLPPKYKLSVIVSNIIHWAIGLGLLSMFIFRLYLNPVGLHVLTWSIIIWIILAAYIVLSRPKLLVKIVRPDKEEIKLLVEQIKKAKQDNNSDSSSIL